MLDFSRFEVLTFDCYGTLIDWETGILATLNRILSAHGKELEDARVLELYADFEQQIESAPYQTYREVLAAVVRRFGNELRFTPTPDEQYALSASLPSWRPWADTPSALRELKTRYRLAILSNIDDDLFAATRPKLGVDFDYVITAEKAKAYKPSLQIFDLMMKRTTQPADRILHVGQSIYHDVVPARSLGIATVWVNRPSVRPGVGAVKAATAMPDLTVSSLEELAASSVHR